MKFVISTPISLLTSIVPITIATADISTDLPADKMNAPINIPADDIEELREFDKELNAFREFYEKKSKIWDSETQNNWEKLQKKRNQLTEGNSSMNANVKKAPSFSETLSQLKLNLRDLKIRTHFPN
jgi:hypothetical protein